MTLTREQFERDAKEKWRKGDREHSRQWETMPTEELRKEIYEELLDIYNYTGHSKLEDERYKIIKQTAFELAIMLEEI